MLTRFEVENFKAFCGRLVFDLKARDYAFNADLVRNGVVKNALVYGPNGIGKSCLGLALFDIISHLTDKQQINPIYLLGYQNLSVPAETPVLFKYEFDFDGEKVVYEYAKSASRDLLWEKLSINDSELVNWDYFNAQKQVLHFAGAAQLKIELPDNKLSVVKYISRNLPTGTVPVIDKLMSFADRMLWYRSLSDGNTYAGFQNGHSILGDKICKAGKLDDFSQFLRRNGLDYKLIGKTVDNQDAIFFVDPKTGRELPFDSISSTGTKALELFYYWSLVSFNELSFLFIDEFDAFIHFKAAAEIVKQLNKSAFQVVLTSHNTYLMQNEFTRPDCCFLMSDCSLKNLPACTDREIREAHNLEKMYQSGVFTE